MTDAVKHAYRSGKTMDALGDFWSQYFEHSHATLVNFGAPNTQAIWGGVSSGTVIGIAENPLQDLVTP